MRRNFWSTSSLTHSWLVFREKNIPLVAKDNVALVHIDCAKSCYVPMRAGKAPGPT